MQPVKINDKWTLQLPEVRAKALPWEHWEYERLDAMYKGIKKGDTIVDIGAEHGDMSALFAKWSGGKMILVEAAENYWPYMKQIFTVNKLSNPYLSYMGFASDQNFGDTKPVKGWPEEADGPITVEGDHGFGFRHLNEQTKDDGEFYEEAIPNMKLDDMIDVKVDIITMDVEGAEYNVLLGATELIKRDRPIIYVSVHPEFIRDRYGYTQDEVLMHMKLLGYKSNYLGQDHEKHFSFTP